MRETLREGHQELQWNLTGELLLELSVGPFVIPRGDMAVGLKNGRPVERQMASRRHWRKSLALLYPNTNGVMDG